jgi:hypothetical protein
MDDAFDRLLSVLPLYLAMKPLMTIGLFIIWIAVAGRVYQSRGIIAALIFLIAAPLTIILVLTTLAALTYQP